MTAQVHSFSGDHDNVPQPWGDVLFAPGAKVCLASLERVHGVHIHALLRLVERHGQSCPTNSPGSNTKDSRPRRCEMPRLCASERSSIRVERPTFGRE